MIMDELIQQLMSETGFIEAFWKECARRQRAGMKSSQREIFDYLNDRYEEVAGVPRYPSFDAFRVLRDRRTRKSQK